MAAGALCVRKEPSACQTTDSHSADKRVLRKWFDASDPNFFVHWNKGEMSLSVPSPAMARGPKKHQNCVAAPKHGMLDKSTGLFAPRSSTGPHKLRECLPLMVFLRNRLTYALTRDEVKKICMQRFMKIDGKVRTNITHAAGVMDVIA